jgi:hypothetical protein
MLNSGLITKLNPKAKPGLILPSLKPNVKEEEYF